MDSILVVKRHSYSHPKAISCRVLLCITLLGNVFTGASRSADSLAGESKADNVSGNHVGYNWMRLGGEAYRHADSISTLEYSDNGNIFLTSGLSTDGFIFRQITIWNAKNGTRVCQWHDDYLDQDIESAVTDPSGELFATVRDWDVIVRNWKTQTTICRVRLAERPSRVAHRNLAFTLDGKRLAVLASSGKVYLLEINTGKFLRVINTGLETGIEISFLNDDTFGVVASEPSAFCIFGLSSGDCQWRLPTNDKNHSKLKIGFEGDYVVAIQKTIAEIWKLLPRPQLMISMPWRQKMPRDVTISRNGKFFVARNFGALCLFDCTTGNELAKYDYWPQFGKPVDYDNFDTHEFGILRFSPDSLSLMVANNGSLRRYTIPGLNPIEDNLGPLGPILDLQFLSDGAKLAALSRDGRMYIWDSRGQKVLFRTNDIEERIYSMVISPKPARFITSNTAGVVEYRDLNSFRVIKQFPVPLPRAYRMAANPKYLAIADHQGNVLVVGAEDGKVRSKFHAHNGGLPPREDEPCTAALSFSQTSELLLTAGPDGLIRWWEPDTGKQAKQVRFCPEGETITYDFRTCLSSDDRFALIDAGSLCQVFDFTTGKLFGQAIKCGAWSKAIFTPDPKSLIISEDHGGLLVRDILSTNGSFHIKGIGGRITCIAFSPDGRKLAAGNVDSTISILEWAKISRHD